LTHFFTSHGLPLLFVVIMLESFGVPLPGETALIAFGILASQGHYSIVVVIAVAATAAIVGDNLGYELIGRRGAGGSSSVGGRCTGAPNASCRRPRS
jgi:membrane protein DedA with SNARE-associated domain